MMSDLQVENRQARFKYHLHEVYVAGLVLEGWEVKALRMKRCNITTGYIQLKDGEAYIIGMQIEPCLTVNYGTWAVADPLRTRKLLLSKAEIKRLTGKVQEKGCTIIPVKLFLKNRKFKMEIAVATGKNDRDKRDDVKERDWKKTQSRIMKTNQL